MKNSASKCTFLITLLIISFSSLLFAAQNQTCHPQDQIAINKIQTAFGLTPTPNCCDWDAVVCSDVAHFRVTEFLINYDSTISGQIPAAIGDLSSLIYIFIIGAPNITGNIPPAITKLTNLTVLVISRAGLSGPIPAFLAYIKNLDALDLSGNALTGSIPPQLSQLRNLTLLLLYGNKLTGSIPKSLGKLNLVSLQLSENSFTGDASFMFGKNKRTTNLNIGSNKFRFDLSKVEFPLHLTALTLAKNHIFGSIPQQITQLKDLDIRSFPQQTSFDLSYNNLCGAIPQGGLLQDYGPDSFSHNKCLCGNPLPPCK